MKKLIELMIRWKMDELRVNRKRWFHNKFFKCNWCEKREQELKDLQELLEAQDK